MSKLCKGIFWAVETEPLKLVTVKAPCDENGNLPVRTLRNQRCAL